MNYIASLRAAQEGLQTGMQQYADWSGRVLEAVHQQSQDTGEAARQVSQAMQESSRGLSESYASFVDGISGGLSRTMGLFEENMHGMISLLDSKLESIEKTAKAAQNGYNLRSEQLQEGTDGLIQSLSRLQRALGDMTARVEQAADALKAAETKTEDA